jgi:hypothetical protein
MSASYHYAVIYVKKNSRDIIKERSDSAILKTETETFGEKPRKSAVPYRDTRTLSMGHPSPRSDIANRFAHQYEELFSCVGYDVTEMCVTL